MIFIARQWESDKIKMARGFSALHEQQPFWLVIFVEGTRFTEAKNAANREYARSQGLPELKYCLLPRAKAFASAVQTLRASGAQAVYDLTIAFPADDTPRFE
jgi:lysophosphatidic acid acyltransferase/lysophosphatidylinositol acyltransferase